MGKFLAVLKDSVREAIDGKIFQVMLVLSGLLILLVASVSYRPVTLKDELENFNGMMNYFTGLNPNAGKPKLSIENYTASNEAEPWQADYRFDYVITAPNADELKRAESMSGMPLFSKFGMRATLKQQYYWLDNIQVEDAKSHSDAEKRFTVTTKGTKITEIKGWQHQPRLFFFWDVPLLTQSLRESVYTVQKLLVNSFGAWIAVLAGVIVTASFVPNLMRKGNVDLTLAKPIGRVQLLLFKYVGGLVFVAALALFTVGGVWVVLGLRTGIWSPHFLTMIPLLTFYFAVLYAVSVLVAVLTRSTVVAILATLIFWAVCTAGGLGYEQVAKVRKAQDDLKNNVAKMAGVARGDLDDDDGPTPSKLSLPNWAYTTADIIHFVLPRTYELDGVTVRLIAEGVLTPAEIKQKKLDFSIQPPWWEVIGLAGAFVVLVVGLACWRFAAQDY